jgi:hypothetical protein
MTTRNLFYVLPLVFGILFTSCQKDQDISEEEVVETIEASLKASDGGAAAGAPEMSAMLVPVKSNLCGFTNDTTITRSTSNWNRSVTWNWVVNCDANNDYENVVFTRSGTASYNGPRLTMNATLTGTITATRLDSAQATHLMNGTFNRVGNSTYTGPNRTRSYTTDLTHTWVDVAVEKDTRHIVSGTGTVVLTGTVSNGNSFNRSGNIVYNGDGTATLTMDNGNVYTFNVR